MLKTPLDIVPNGIENPRVRSLIAFAMSCLVLTSCGYDDSSGGEDEAPPGPLEAAYESCEEVDEGTDFVTSSTLGMDGETVIIDSTASEKAGLFSAVCLLARSGAPDSIAANMGTTTAMMGRQSDSYDDIEVQWSYSGMDGGGGFQATFRED